MQFMQSEAGRKLMADPRFQKAVMELFNRRAKLQRAVTKRVQAFARRHRLATRDDVAELKRRLRELERKLGERS